MIYRVETIDGSKTNNYSGILFKDLEESITAFSLQSFANGLVCYFNKDVWRYVLAVKPGDRIKAGGIDSTVTKVDSACITLANGTMIIDPKNIVIEPREILKVGSYAVTNHPDWVNIHGKLLLVIGFENDYYRLRNAESGKWVSSGIHMKFVHKATQAKVDNQIVKEFLDLKGYN